MEARHYHPARERTAEDNLVSKWFRRFVHFPTVAPHDNLHTAVDLISYGEVGSVVAVENGVPIGIITERDILKLPSYDLRKYRVRDVMRGPVITIKLEEHLGDALIIMSERNIRHLPVIERGKLVGILTEREILRWIVESHIFPSFHNPVMTRISESPLSTTRA